jgi:hypothetical protein
MIMIMIALGRAHMDSTPWTWNLATLAAFFLRDRWRRTWSGFARTAEQPGSLEESP